ncbi:hypothetical protein OEZ85_000218 [Tetradesmus obliquus]|uniref:Acyltransferase n=1 Tax=Tetradesmus obliquus TaxID=3088 RepID=A0ABY8UPI9_TETOB|nr:hypothetical protein OEZ85_000218 [Tetradesmus obliquus]
MEAEKAFNDGKVAELFANTRVYSDGLSKDHKQSLISWLVAVTTLTIYTGWMHILLGLMLGSFFSRSCLYLLLAIWATTWLPAKPVLWSAFCSSWVFKTWREYFSFSYLNEAELELGKRYIFVEVPHGVFPLSEILAGTNCQAIWPHWKVYSLAASSVFGVPLWRHFLTWIGCVPATSANFKKMLAKGSVAVVVGGIAEMYMQHPHKERIMLANRKGFVRVAVEQGLDGGIVPVYHFGNTQVFDFWPQSLSAVARKRRAAYGFLVGWWGTPVPRKVPLFQVSGRPIPVPKVDKNDTMKFNQTVDEVHAQVVAELQAMYNRHRASYSAAWAERPLVIE